MTDRVFNFLVLCTGNSARSIMAEALINTMGGRRFKAYSAASQPGGIVNPFAIEQVAATGYPPDARRSKSWDEFNAPNAPVMDFIITVCDNAAGEVCPIWPGHPMTPRWGFEDPSVHGTDKDKRRAFTRRFRQIRGRVSTVVARPLPVLDRQAIKHAPDAIGRRLRPA